MLVFGYGITMDVENLAFAALDRDDTPESRAYVQEFAGSRYFIEHPPIADGAALERRLRSGELRLAIEIPPGFGRDVDPRPAGRGRRPGSTAPCRSAPRPCRATSRACTRAFLAKLARRRNAPASRARRPTLETRFRYNQDFKSLYAMVPGTIAILLVFIPAILTALGVVREKELGSITNLYVTPTRRSEFLLGKQLPYILLAMLNYALLVATAVLLFGVPLKGSLPGADPGGAALRHGHDRHRPADVGLHPDPDRRAVRHRHPHHRAGAAILRPDRADLDADRWRRLHRARSSPPPISCASASASSPRRSALRDLRTDAAGARRLHPGADRAQHRWHCASRSAERCDAWPTSSGSAIKELRSLAADPVLAAVHDLLLQLCRSTPRRPASPTSCATPRSPSSTRIARSSRPGSRDALLPPYFQPPELITGGRRSTSAWTRRATPSSSTSRRISSATWSPATGRRSSSTSMPPR